RQVGAEERVRGLVVHQLALARERQTSEVVPAAHVLGRPHAGRAPSRRLERVGAHDGPQERLRALPLLRAQRRGVQRLERRIEDHSCSAGSWFRYSRSAPYSSGWRRRSRAGCLKKCSTATANVSASLVAAYSSSAESPSRTRACSATISARQRRWASA